MITDDFLKTFHSERNQWLKKLHKVENALNDLYAGLPPGIVMRNVRDNRNAIVESVELRDGLVWIQGRIIRIDGGTKEKSQHL